VIEDKEPPEDALMTKLVGTGSKQGSTWFGKAGDITKRPPVWAGMAAALAMTGPRGRQAAKRGAVSYVAGAGAHLAVKLVVGRSRPPGASRHTTIGPITSSFPSGHCASELAFSLGAAQEVPWLIVPL
jgi:membrane-associated phospholipid phosphatase